ncbi:putative bifunctional diguanylate cyclase/phosphodiesterase [Marinobacter salicampi]|uniref:putative bifunctional diguanylate cyclase/phosphodiesterase n=1 Tax=Marinobacter salicampi TaxID=435907 RepID=UPI00140A2A0D|nr:bifunctional diguanylate cyclase/phosphodiesterase [Marinobacter salicampi]
MPIDVATGEMQSTDNWLYRTGAFVLVGALSGYFRSVSLSYINRITWVRSHDASTSLPNRVALAEQIEHMAKHRDCGGIKVLLIVYINNLDEVEQAYGPASSEGLLRTLAVTMLSHYPEASPHRIDNNQLAFFLCMKHQVEVESLLSEARRRVQMPTSHNGFSVYLDVSIGYTFLEWGAGSPAQQLSRTLSLARLSSRGSSREKVFFFADSRDRENATKENLEMLTSFKQAIENDELRLYFQPKVELGTGRISGAEALVRWLHPKKGFILPYLFIPLVENSTLINDLTTWVLQEAARQQRAWAEQGVHISIAINVSSTNLVQAGFAEAAKKVMKEAGVDPRYIEFEITESAIMDNFQEARNTLVELVNFGFTIAIDDFGTGHSSLKYLAQLPAQVVKIDRSFVQDLSQVSEGWHIVKAIIELGQSLGKTIVAEGIEDQGMLCRLTDYGCDYGQGYFIAKPLPADEFYRWYQTCDGQWLPQDKAFDRSRKIT